MRIRSGIHGVLAATIATLGLGVTMTVGVGAGPAYTVTKDQVFHVTNLGPAHDTACDIYYDLYKPADASATHQVPVIITTNGFGGSKNDAEGSATNPGPAEFWASHDYEVLTYSGLGFGGSTCEVYTDDVSWDGAAAAQIVDWLGSAAHPEVIKDGPGDPRLGTWGGSYGGGFQFALAAASTKVDAMVPEITWNDLTYSLAPNSNSADFKYNYAATAPGVQKVGWSMLFYSLGNAEPALNQGYSGWTNTDATSAHTANTGTPPNPACPGYELLICVETTKTLAEAYPSPGIVARLQHASAAYALAPFAGNSGHFPPTMLIQGETDTLFNLNDAVANYRLWQSKGAPVKLVFRNEGHSGGDSTITASEYNYSGDARGYLSLRTLNWYDHYLKKQAGVDTGPGFEYFRDWVTYDHNSTARPAFGSAPAFPVGDQVKLFLSGGDSMTESGSLVGKVSQVQAGSITFSNGAPGTSYSDMPEVPQDGPTAPPPTDPAGQYASFSTGALANDLDVVGVPMADFTISDAAPVNGIDPSLDVTLFAKIYDVAPDGSKLLVHRLVSPVRIADPSKPVHVNLPGIVHRFVKGHALTFVVATTDATHQVSRATHVLTIAPAATNPGTLVLPVLGSSPAAAAGPTATVPAPAQLPDTSTSSPAGLLAVIAVLGALALALTPRRRSRQLG